jgi:hypothetical protein
MEEDELVSSCERFARWGSSLTDTEARLASKICCAARKFLEHDCRGLVMEHSRTPMLCAEGIDLTPLQTNTVTKGMFCGRRLMRKSKDSGEHVSCRFFSHLTAKHRYWLQSLFDLLTKQLGRIFSFVVRCSHYSVTSAIRGLKSYIDVAIARFTKRTSATKCSTSSFTLQPLSGVVMLLLHWSLSVE